MISRSQFSKLDRWPKKKRNDNFKTEEHSFSYNLDELFDIYCHDGTQRHALEKQHGFRMTKKEYDYYDDQKKNCLARKTVWLLLNHYNLPTFHSKKDTLTSKTYRFDKFCSRDAANVSSYSGQVESSADALLASALLST